MKLFKGIDLGTGVALGLGAALVGPKLLEALSGAARPMAKSAIKGSLALYDRARVAVAEAVEVAGDLAAEARSEMQAEQAPPSHAQPKQKHAEQAMPMPPKTSHARKPSRSSKSAS